MKASEQYSQAACVENLDSAMATLESLARSVDIQNRLSVFCAKSVVEANFHDTVHWPNSSRGKHDLIAKLSSTLLGQREVFACHQRLSALGKQVLVVGALASGAVTGALAMFLQQHGLERAIAREHEQRVADGQLLIVVSCGGDDVAFCETIYEALSTAAS